MQLLIVSTSTVYGQPYLSYLDEEILDFFKAKKHILFIPYARPSGLSWDDYTSKAAEKFTALGFEMRGVHTFDSHTEALAWAQGVFTGGGNTFLLLKTIYDTGLFTLLDDAVKNGLPYMGTSAGCNITGISIGTTNDMPIVYPPSFDAFGWVPFNLNPHYLDPAEGSTHMGETREQRIAEFHHFNSQPVVGLREGSWLRLTKNKITLNGKLTARVFKAGQAPVEVMSGEFKI
jgi:dipeptidase E